VDELNYSIPLRYRRLENLHIVFWLIKDLCWCLVFPPLGIAMIFPTLLISLVITWRNRHIVTELAHNLAISLWITANSYWMISEFFHFDEEVLSGSITYKHVAVIPFALGILCLLWYYGYYRLVHERSKQAIAHAELGERRVGE
jgi:hypothetical protein